MSDHTQQSPDDQFLLVDDAARSLKLDSKILRQAIACALVPIRLDNAGLIRVHLSEVPGELQSKIDNADVQLDLQAQSLADEVLSLENSRQQSEAQRLRLEALIQKQGAVIARYSSLLDAYENKSQIQNEGDASLVGDASVASVAGDANLVEKLRQRDGEVEKLSRILQRTFALMEIRDQQVATQTDQLSLATDKAFNLLERAVRESEISAEQLQRQNQQIAVSAKSDQRLEQELDERNSVIKSQNSLMERMVSLVESSVSSSPPSKPRKRTFWQRLFGEGKGI